MCPREILLLRDTFLIIVTSYLLQHSMYLELCQKLASECALKYVRNQAQHPCHSLHTLTKRKLQTYNCTHMKQTTFNNTNYTTNIKINPKP